MLEIYPSNSKVKEASPLDDLREALKVVKIPVQAVGGLSLDPASRRGYN